MEFLNLSQIHQVHFWNTMTSFHSEGSLSNYSIEKQIGSGSFGQIYLAIKNEPKNENNQNILKKINGQDGKNGNSTQFNYTILKKINLSLLTTEEEKASAWHEVEILKLLDHPNIIKYQGAWIEDQNLWIEMEFAQEGDLHIYITKCKEKKEYLPEEKIWKWFVQLCLALKHCHDKNILHRDIKTQNIFICDDDTIKLGDFGISKILSTSTMFAQTQIGSPFSMSPEVCEDKPYNQKSDIWSLGCVLYEMCTLNHAFDAKNLCALILRILRGKYPPIPDHYSDNLKDLISAMLQQKPENRPQISEILGHPFVQNICTKLIMDVNKVAENDIALRRENNKSNLLNGVKSKSKTPNNPLTKQINKNTTKMTKNSTINSKASVNQTSKLAPKVTASVVLPSRPLKKESNSDQVSASVSIPSRNIQDKKKPSLESMRRKRLENSDKNPDAEELTPELKFQWFDQVQQEMKQIERMMNPLDSTMISNTQKENILKEQDILKQQKIGDRKKFIAQQIKKNAQESIQEKIDSESPLVIKQSFIPPKVDNSAPEKKEFKSLVVKNDVEQRKKEYLKERELKKKQQKEEEQNRIKEHKRRMKEIEKGAAGPRIAPKLLQLKEGKEVIKEDGKIGAKEGAKEKKVKKVKESPSLQNDNTSVAASIESSQSSTPSSVNSPTNPMLELEKRKQKRADDRNSLRQFIQAQKKNKGRASIHDVEIVAPEGNISYLPEPQESVPKKLKVKKEKIIDKQEIPVSIQVNSRKSSVTTPDITKSIQSSTPVTFSKINKENDTSQVDNTQLSIRIEQLRKECEEYLGESTFYSIYDLIRQNSESLDVDSSNFMSQITQIVPPNKIQFLTFVHQLIFCEDKFYR